MNTNEDLVAAAHAELTKSIEGLIASNEWEKHLKMQARFHNYSFGNVMWLLSQSLSRGVFPTRFAGFNTWKGVGRSVRKGEKSFKVLAPVMIKKSSKENVAGEEQSGWVIRGFKVVSTFERSQTDGAEEPSFVKTLSGTSEEVEETYNKLSTFITKKGWTVTKGDTKIPGANGVAHLLEKTIMISEGLSGLQSLKTLCHEVAHAMMHADDIGAHGASEREVEAESVAFVVLNALGFDSADYSFGYVAHWSKGDATLVKKTGERVQRTAKAILTSLGVKSDAEAA